MPWEPGEGHGFTSPGVEPWLPFGDHDGASVAEQRADPRSALNLCRELLALRGREPDLRSGAYEQLDAPEGVWAFRRGDGHVIALNLSTADVGLALVGTVLLATDRAGEQMSSTVCSLPVAASSSAASPRRRSGLPTRPFQTSSPRTTSDGRSLFTDAAPCGGPRHGPRLRLSRGDVLRDPEGVAPSAENQHRRERVQERKADEIQPGREETTPRYCTG